MVDSFFVIVRIKSRAFSSVNSGLSFVPGLLSFPVGDTKKILFPNEGKSIKANIMAKMYFIIVY